MANQKPLLPANDLLLRGAPLLIWERAKKECVRCPMLRFRAAAVIFNNKGILSAGCAYPAVERCKTFESIHAEHCALRQGHHLDLEGAWIVVYTMNANGGCAWSSRPCYSCASLLYKRGIERVIYPERRIDDSWLLQTEYIEDLLERNIVVSGPFAKMQRIPD